MTELEHIIADLISEMGDDQLANLLGLVEFEISNDSCDGPTDALPGQV